MMEQPKDYAPNPQSGLTPLGLALVWISIAVMGIVFMVGLSTIIGWFL